MPAIDRSEATASLLVAAALLVTLCSGLVACGDPAVSTSSSASSAPKASTEAPPEPIPEPLMTAKDSHQKMLARLLEIAAATDQENPFFGRLPLDQAIAKLDQASSSNPGEQIQAFIDKAMHELRLGLTDEAVESAESAYRLLLTQPADTIVEARPKVLIQAGLSHLRAGEVENCVKQHNRDSCILPIREGGVHTLKHGSEAASQYFLRALEFSNPGSRDFIKASWLLNIAAMTLGTYPESVPEEYRVDPKNFGSTIEFARFGNISNEVGLDTRNLSGGVVIDDLDGDHDLDIMTSTWDPSGNLRYFRNEGEDGFVDRTTEAGLEGLTGGLNMIHADYDNDGDVDVLVLRGAWMRHIGNHPNSLLRNRGDGTFEDVAYRAGIAGNDHPTQAAAFADYDNDGDLDLYVGNESSPGFSVASQLFRNNGNGTFSDVAEAAGVQNFGYAKGVAWGDIDNDGFIDLYVSNMGGDNRLYRNNGQGKFSDIAKASGVLGPRLSFPCWFFDFDNDGILDIYCAAYVQDLAESVKAYFGQAAREHGILYRGAGNGRFEDISKKVGLDRLVTTMGANFGDLDNDGFLDFYLGTGFPNYDALLPNVMYRNRNGGYFDDVTWSGGFGHLQKGHGIAFADLDADGDQDVFEQMGGAFPGDSFMDALYLNPGTKNHYVELNLVGTKSNRSAIGAQVTVVLDNEGERERIFRTVGAQGSFGSAPFRLHIGLGQRTDIRRVEIYWPRTGETQVVKGLLADHAYRIVEGQDVKEEIKKELFHF